MRGGWKQVGKRAGQEREEIYSNGCRRNILQVASQVLADIGPKHTGRKLNILQGHGGVGGGVVHRLRALCSPLTSGGKVTVLDKQRPQGQRGILRKKESKAGEGEGGHGPRNV